MIQIKHILCPVDFSDFSRRALEQAAVIARWYDSTVTALHAYATSPVLFTGDLGPIPMEPAPPPPQEIREQILGELTRFTDSIRASGVPISLDVRPGGSVQSILDEATSLPADLIVMGTHGRGGMDRLVLGSVTEKVLRKASCPVLTVPPPVSGPAREAPALLARILCPVDFSESSMKALTYALSLAKEADAQLLVLHVLEGFRAEKLTASPNFDLPRYVRHLEDEALAHLRQAVPDDARTWCEPEELLATGKAYREILRMARERDVRLIVMGVHGRNPVDLLFFGSTTHHVIRLATCPVLTLRG